MNLAIVADAHLGGPGGDGEELAEQLAALPARGCRHLLLMGDIFHIWVGYQKFETPEVRRLVPVLAELRRQGLRIDYIEGNRDFFIARSPWARLFDRVTSEISFEHEGVRYLAVHGDGLNDHDRQYLFWRWLSKSPAVRLGTWLLPGFVARWLMHGTERRLAQTNFKHRNRIPREAIERYAERRFAEGHDVLLLGHFHEPHTWTTPNGQVRLLDAWFRSRRVEGPEGSVSPP